MQTTANNSRTLGTDDSVNTCQCCGKTNLKFTVVIELAHGEIVHYGQICARRNTGKDQRTITSEIKAAEQARVAAARAEFLASPEYAAERARLEEREQVARTTGQRMLGRVAADFVREVANAATAVRVAIATKHKVSPWSFSA